jgi:hypothetical protein
MLEGERSAIIVVFRTHAPTLSHPAGFGSPASSTGITNCSRQIAIDMAANIQ